MRFRMPSMSALVAFEATARHSSITRAADELALTESAISRQISQLEDQLGIPLFYRIKKRLSLTRAGMTYAKDITSVLERIEKNTSDVMSTEGKIETLEIATLPTVGSLWLIPRLIDFHHRYPNILVNLSSRNSRFIFNESSLDGALCFGDIPWPGAHKELLFHERLFVVGGGQLVPQQGLWRAEQIMDAPRLHLLTRPTAWSSWAQAAGAVEGNLLTGQRFEVQSMLIAAACAGLGLALLPRFLIEAPVRRGELHIISTVSVRSEGAYYFAYPEQHAQDPQLLNFRAWLQEQVQTFQESDPTLRQ